MQQAAGLISLSRGKRRNLWPLDLSQVVLQDSTAMASRSSRTQPFNPPFSASSTQAQIQALPLAMLRLCLDHFHLQYGGRKEAVVNHLYHHVNPTSGDDSSRDSSDSDGDPSETPTASENPDDSTDDDGDDSDTPSHTTSQPFTQVQQSALVGTVKELLCKGKHACKSPTLSSPSDEPHRGRDSSHRGSKRHRHWSSSPYPPTHSHRHRKSRHHTPSSSSESSASSTSSSSSSSSDSPPMKRHHHSHRRQLQAHRPHRKSSRLTRHWGPTSAIPVPKSLARRIGRGEFVDLSKLLSQHLILSGSLLKSARSKRSLIANFDMWLEAWNVYAGVLTSHKPGLAPELFQYLAFISRCSCRFQPYAWLQYDAQFRLKIASNPSMSWSVADPEFIASWLTADAIKRKSTCFSCGNPDHLSSDCPLRPSTKEPGLCCPVCDTTGHVARDCPQLLQGKPNATTTKPQTMSAYFSTDVVVVFEDSAAPTLTSAQTVVAVTQSGPAPSRPTDSSSIHAHTIHTSLRPQRFG